METKGDVLRIGLLGINAGRTEPWCVEAREIIASIDPSVETWDPQDDAWNGIDWSSGDAVQPVIDGIVDSQFKGIKACDAFIVCLTTAQPGLGARLELGRIMWTKGLRLHIVIVGDVMGRHYIRGHFRGALAKIQEHGSLGDAVAAIFRDFSS